MWLRRRSRLWRGCKLWLRRRFQLRMRFAVQWRRLLPKPLPSEPPGRPVLWPFALRLFVRLRQWLR
jgi:hypothetical protein